jgi:hypothetical protein
MSHHRTIAVIDLRFFARGGRDHDARLRRRRPAERHDKAAHARIPRGEAVIVDEVLPDRHGVATSAERLADQLSIRLARARTRRTARTLTRSRVGGHLRPGGRFRLARLGGRRLGNGRIYATRVGGHRGSGNGRFRPRCAPAAARHHDARGLEIAADRFAPDTGRPLDAPQRPAQSPQRHNLVVFVVSQDVAHAA